MDLFDWFWNYLERDFEEPVDKYERSARTLLEELRQDARREYGVGESRLHYDFVGKKLKYHIDCQAKQGGEESYKFALARWQLFNALYPDYIKDEDRPSLVPQIWKNHPPHP